MKKLIFLLALLVPFSASAKLLDLSVFKLDNGIEVAVIENHKAPVVLQMIYYKTGSINDPRGKGGIAHLLEHLMFRGTKKVPDQMFNRLTDEYGAVNNAYTTYSETGYYEFSDISKLELMMVLEADRMQNLKISDEAFLKERQVVLEERMQRFETKPTPLFYENLNKLLWQEHPMSNPVSGSVSEIKNLTKKDAEEFYQRWYRPDNALLVLAGDISVKEAKILAQKHYGKIEKKGTMPEMDEQQSSRAIDMFIKTKLAGIQQQRFVSYRRLDAQSLTKKDILALSLLAEYLSGDDTSYLYDKLVYEGKKLLSIDMGVSYDEKFGGVVSFYATPVQGVTNPENINEILETEIKAGIRALEIQKLEKIKHQMLSETIYLQEDPENSARFVGNMLLADYSDKEIMNYDEEMMKITIEDVLEAWKKVEASNIRVKGYLEGRE